MAKMKNEDFLREAKLILDFLSVARFENTSTPALMEVAKAAMESGDGRFAFEKATSAKAMFDFEMRNLK